MTNAWFLGAQESVAQTENEVRSTVEPVRDDPANAEASTPPDWNEFQSDDSGELVGLSPREKGADTTDSEQYVPWWTSLASAMHNPIVDQQVSTSGTAAAREQAGEQGHGTMQYANSVDPIVREGAALGTEYMVLDAHDIQAGAGAYMTPADTDNWNSAVAAQTAEAESRKSYQSTLYNSWLNG